MLGALRAIESVTRVLTGLILMVIMFVVFADVVLRYVFHAPLVWAHDLIAMYLMVALFFLALSWSYAAGQHITVDLLYRRMSVPVRNLARALSSILSAIIIAIIGWKVGLMSYDSWRLGDVIAGPIAWPTWIPSAIAMLGCILLLVRLVTEAIRLVLNPRNEQTAFVAPIEGME